MSWWTRFEIRQALRSKHKDTTPHRHGINNPLPPEPEYAPPKTEVSGLFVSFCAFVVTILRICIKLVVILAVFFVALIGALVWRK